MQLRKFSSNPCTFASTYSAIPTHRRKLPLVVLWLAGDPEIALACHFGYLRNEHTRERSGNPLFRFEMAYPPALTVWCCL